MQAVNAVAAFRPDVVLLDIGLPRINGYDVCRQIRKQANGQELVIVALTGWGQQRDRRIAYELVEINRHLQCRTKALPTLRVLRQAVPYDG